MNCYTHFRLKTMTHKSHVACKSLIAQVIVKILLQLVCLQLTLVDNSPEKHCQKIIQSHLEVFGSKGYKQNSRVVKASDP